MIRLLIILMVFASAMFYFYIQMSILKLGKRLTHNIPTGWQIEDLERLIDEGHCKSEAIADVVREVINIGPWSSALDPSFISVLNARLNAMDTERDREEQ